MPRLVAYLALLALAVAPSTAGAHVYLETPAEGANVDPGSDVTITWEIAVNHGAPNVYDLMFSTDGGAQFELVAANREATPSEYVWTAPDYPVTDAVLAIVQHGSGGYTFMHEVHFTIGTGGAADMGSEVDMGSETLDMGSDASDAELFARPDATMAMPDDDGPVPRTGEEVLELLEHRCAMSGCHASDNPRAGLDLTVEAFPANLVDAQATTNAEARRVDPDAPNSSELLARLRGERELRMPPPPEPEFSAERIDAVADWIAGGAPQSGAFDVPASDDEQEVMGDDGDDRGCATPGFGASPLLLVALFAGLALLRSRPL